VKDNLHRLQLIQNTLARAVTGVNRRQHITPALAHLNWLPITARIKYKIGIAMLTFKNSEDQPTCVPGGPHQTQHHFHPIENPASATGHLQSNIVCTPGFHSFVFSHLEQSAS